MRRRWLQLLLAIAFFSAPAWASFSLVQDTGNSNTSCSGSSCTTTPSSAIGAGHLLVMDMWALGGSSSTITSVSGGGTWVQCTQCEVQESSGTFLTVWYVLSSTSASSITESGSSPNLRIALFEFSFTAASVAVDGTPPSATTSTTSASSYSSPSCTIGGTNDAVIAMVNDGGGSGAALTVNGGYTTDLLGAGNIRGGAYLLNTTTGTGVTWTAAASNQPWSAGAIAFKEVSASFAGFPQIL